MLLTAASQCADVLFFLLSCVSALLMPPFYISSFFVAACLQSFLLTMRLAALFFIITIGGNPQRLAEGMFLRLGLDDMASADAFENIFRYQ